MFFVFVQYLWPRIAPCFAGVGVIAQAAYTVLGLSLKGAPSEEGPAEPESKSLLKAKWAAWDEEASIELVGAPPALPARVPLLRERYLGVSGLGAKECAERLDARRLLPARSFTAAQRPNVAVCVGFEVDVAQTFCVLAGVETCDAAFVQTVLKTMQLLHCCGYSWEVTLMTLAVALVYAESPCPGSRHGRDCACANIRARKGLLGETWQPCSAVCLDSGSDATSPTLSTYGFQPQGEGSEATLAERSRLLCDRVVLLLFLSHCYLIDDPCFLCTWNSYVFTAPRERDLEGLNGELMQLFKARGYQLRVDAAVVLPLYARLEQAVRAHPAGQAYDLAGPADAPA